jgi:hypothetical protein
MELENGRPVGFVVASLGLLLGAGVAWPLRAVKGFLELCTPEAPDGGFVFGGSERDVDWCNVEADSGAIKLLVRLYSFRKYEKIRKR